MEKIANLLEYHKAFKKREEDAILARQNVERDIADAMEVSGITRAKIGCCVIVLRNGCVTIKTF